MTSPRRDDRLAEILATHNTPLMELVFQAQNVHRAHFVVGEIELCTLLSIKTGGCPEDCHYCSQSAHFAPGRVRSELVGLEEVIEAAKRAKDNGSNRFCMGAAWKKFPADKQKHAVKEMVSAVAAIGLEVCVTLGKLSYEDAKELKDAGLHTYNHNIDTSPEYYEKIVTTREFSERLETISNVQRAGISVCCGGILGMGESVQDRCRMLQELAGMQPHPQSVPINILVPIAATPLANAPKISVDEVIRVIATARILMPQSRIRLSAGRSTLSPEGQFLCFFAGANSIFSGESLLTTPNANPSADAALFRRYDLAPKPHG